MAAYFAFVDGGPGAWGLAFPDAPGCTAMAGDFTQLHANAVAALREWMEDRLADGLELPRPRDVGEMLDEVEGRSIVQIPLLLDAGRTVRANISVSAGTLEQIDRAAKDRNLTRSAFLVSAAIEKIAGGR